MSKKFKEVTQETFKLPSVPKWVQWLAVDKHSTLGTLWGYSEKPLTNGITFWHPTESKFWPKIEYSVVEITTGYAHTPEPIKRPEND